MQQRYFSAIEPDAALGIFERISTKISARNTITDPVKSEAELTHIRETVFSLDNEAWIDDMVGAAVPILSENGTLGGALVRGLIGKGVGQLAECGFDEPLRLSVGLGRIGLVLGIERWHRPDQPPTDKQSSTMNDSPPYTPPNVWKWESESGGTFANINRPIAGKTHEKELPVGRHPLQLYSLATPNGVKVTVLLEELLALGHSGAEYDAYVIKIREGEQFGSGFVAINPNSKIPALVDHSTPTPTRVFESGAILLYLAEKFGAFVPKDPSERAECLSWLFWQMGSAPYLGGGFGHFYSYAPFKIEYAIDRFAMEVKRQLDVLDGHLADNRFMCGNAYTIADMAIWPWYGALVLNKVYGAAEFLEAQSYTHVNRWTQEIAARPAVQRGRMVNRISGSFEEQLRERHDAGDFDTKTQDKIEGAS